MKPARSEIDIDFADCDPARIIFYPRYFDICGGSTRVWALQTIDDPWAEDPACYLSNTEMVYKDQIVAAE